MDTEALNDNWLNDRSAELGMIPVSVMKITSNWASITVGSDQVASWAVDFGGRTLRGRGLQYRLAQMDLLSR